MNGNDFASGFSALFSKVGLLCLWGTFIAGFVLRWVANARVKAQVKFLTVYDRSLLSLKDTPSLSQAQLREKSEATFRNYYPSRGGKRWAQTLDRVLGGEASSWQIIDRVVNLAFDKRGGLANERARYVLSSIDSMTYFFKKFSLGAFHRLGAATPALLVILGALGTYTGFLTALPELAPQDLADADAVAATISGALGRMGVHTGFAILGSLLAAASVVANAIWDAERSFQSATNRLAHIVEFLGGIETSDTSAGFSEAAEASATLKRGKPRHAPVEETTASPEEKSEAPAARHAKKTPAPAAVTEEPATADNGDEYGSAAQSSAVEKPVTRRPRAEVVRAEADWGPLPLSAVPSPKKKPIRVEAAEAPKFEESHVSDDDFVAEQIAPEITVPEERKTAPAAKAAPKSSPQATAAPASAPIGVPAPLPPFEEQVPFPPSPGEMPEIEAANSDFQFPETALPADWDEQIRGLKNELASMQPAPAAPAEPESPAPEVAPLPTEIPYDEVLEKTIVGTPQLAANHAPEAAPVAAQPAAAHDSPTEAELIAMMVPKEWSTQRPADHLPAGMTEDELQTPLAPTPQPQPQLRSVPAKPAAQAAPKSEARAHSHATAAAAPAAPAAPVMSAADRDRLAILGHRMDKVSLYLSKASEDLKEGIISQEMYEDETNRWRHEVENLTKEIAALTSRKAA